MTNLDMLLSRRTVVDVQFLYVGRMIHKRIDENGKSLESFRRKGPGYLLVEVDLMFKLQDTNFGRIRFRLEERIACGKEHSGQKILYQPLGIPSGTSPCFWYREIIPVRSIVALREPT